MHAQGAALAKSDCPFPVILFSHGLAGTRNTYSLFCSELASRGYVVLAIEHACGTASTCKLAGAGSLPLGAPYTLLQHAIPPKLMLLPRLDSVRMRTASPRKLAGAVASCAWTPLLALLQAFRSIDF